MNYFPLFTRLAIDSHYCPRIDKLTTAFWNYNNLYQYARDFCPLTTDFAMPVTTSMCLCCGNVIHNHHLSGTFFVTCCARCYEEVPYSMRVREMVGGSTTDTAGFAAINAVLRTNTEAMTYYPHYLRKISLTGVNPFETIIARHKEKLNV